MNKPWTWRMFFLMSFTINFWETVLEASCSLLRKVLVKARRVTRRHVYVAKMLKEIRVCFRMICTTDNLAVKGSERAGERHWSRSAHLDCRMCSGLFPSSLSMISRKWNHNSDPLQRSNTSLPDISPSVTYTFQHGHLYITVAFCLNTDILQCQIWSHCWS